MTCSSISTLAIHRFHIVPNHEACCFPTKNDSNDCVNVKFRYTEREICWRQLTNINLSSWRWSRLNFSSMMAIVCRELVFYWLIIGNLWRAALQQSWDWEQCVLLGDGGHVPGTTRCYFGHNAVCWPPSFRETMLRFSPILFYQNLWSKFLTKF